MSWGELSCINKPCPIPKCCTAETCNKNCPEYKSNNAARPVYDSKHDTGKEYCTSIDQLYSTTAFVVYEEYREYGFQNKTFTPKSLEACEIALREIVASNGLTLDWLNSVTKAYIEGKAIMIELNNKWRWTFLAREGSRTDLYRYIKKAAIALEGKKPKKSKWGKNYFGGGRK